MIAHAASSTNQASGSVWRVKRWYPRLRRRLCLQRQLPWPDTIITVRCDRPYAARTAGVQAALAHAAKRGMERIADPAGLGSLV